MRDYMGKQAQIDGYSCAHRHKRLFDVHVRYRTISKDKGNGPRRLAQWQHSQGLQVLL